MMEKLLYLIEGGAEQWRIDLAASALLAKIILKLHQNADSIALCRLRDSLIP